MEGFSPAVRGVDVLPKVRFEGTATVLVADVAPKVKAEGAPALLVADAAPKVNGAAALLVVDAAPKLKVEVAVTLLVADTALKVMVAGAAALSVNAARKLNFEASAAVPRARPTLFPRMAVVVSEAVCTTVALFRRRHVLE